MENRRLNGWKEIEKYIGLSEEQIRQYKYPVRKHPGAKNCMVFAFTQELLEHALSMPTIYEYQK